MDYKLNINMAWFFPQTTMLWLWVLAFLHCCVYVICDCSLGVRYGCQCTTQTAVTCLRPNFTTIPEDIVDTKTQIQELRIKNADIQKLSVFPKRYSSLLVLRVQNSKVTAIEKGAFKNLPSLRTLDLCGNKLDTLSFGAFQGLEKLSSILDLSQNLINVLHGDNFSNLKALRVLNISCNRLTGFLGSPFQHLESLETLDVRSNNITRGIGKISLKGLYQLETFHFSDNEALYVSRNAFTDSNSTIKEVYLQGNMIQTLYATTLPWKQLHRIDLRQNPWKCDCRLRWVKGQQGILDNNSRDFTCASPVSLAGLEIASISAEKFFCRRAVPSHNESVAVGITIAVILLLLLLSCMVFINRDKLACCKRIRQTRYSRANRSRESQMAISYNEHRPDDENAFLS
ncbi:slit homolog 2 protein-like [Lineus longissimus]|uniref:slit homolog 2 protein-like n=1 Tax=Lineus longissimus TaxID=88925 RepID=UPI00315D984C